MTLFHSTTSLSYLCLLLILKTRTLALSWFGLCNILNAQTLVTYCRHCLSKYSRCFFAPYVQYSSDSYYYYRRLRAVSGFPDPALYYTYGQRCGLMPTQWLKTLGIAGTRDLPAPTCWSTLGRENSLLIDPTFVEPNRFFRLSSLKIFPSPMMPLAGHPDFIPGLTDSFFLQAPKGLMRPSLFLGCSGWITMDNLLSGRATLTLDRWRINQLTHFLSSLPKPTLFAQKLHQECC